MAEDTKKADAKADEKDPKPLPDVTDPTDETPPEKSKTAPKNPEVPDSEPQDRNPQEQHPSGDFVNSLNTAHLSAAQAARVNGTQLDGAGGAVVLGIAATRTPTVEERGGGLGGALAKASREEAQKRSDKELADEKAASKK